MDRTRVRRLRALVALPFIRATSVLCRFLPWSFLQWLGQRVGGLAYSLSGRDRTRSNDHLALAYPPSNPRWRRATVREAFRCQVTNLLEVFHLAGKKPEAIDPHVEVVGWEHLERARESGRPVILVTGHCGNWELLGAIFGRRGVPLAAVVRGMSEKALEPLVERLRTAFGSQTINRGEPGAARDLLAALRGGTPLLMLIDQDIRTDGVWVPFFGRLAHTPVGAARLAIKRNALTLTAFMERLEDGRHRAILSPPLELPPSPLEATALLTREIENQVRRCPTQWVWWHRRWRTAPPLDDDERVLRALDA